MNELDKALMDAPSIETLWCPFCGRIATQKHHIVPRSRGGKDGPTMNVCGLGNAAGCHGKLHQHLLHLKYEDEWYFLETEYPTKYQDALEMDGWQKLRGRW